jgi:hypothetical protein
VTGGRGQPAGRGAVVEAGSAAILAPGDELLAHEPAGRGLSYIGVMRTNRWPFDAAATGLSTVAESLLEGVTRRFVQNKTLRP